jgi:triosephosphate isomerase
MTTSRKGVIGILYGGSAGSGMLAKIAEVADGLFLGRFAHDLYKEVGRA